MHFPKSKSDIGKVRVKKIPSLLRMSTSGELNITCCRPKRAHPSLDTCMEAAVYSAAVFFTFRERATEEELGGILIQYDQHPDTQKMTSEEWQQCGCLQAMRNQNTWHP